MMAWKPEGKLPYGPAMVEWPHDAANSLPGRSTGRRPPLQAAGNEVPTRSTHLPSIPVQTRQNGTG